MGDSSRFSALARIADSGLSLPMIGAFLRRSLPACLIAPCLGAALFLAVTCPALADMESGRAAFGRGDFMEALKEWRPLAEAGDPRAQHYLGYMNYNGIGIAQDFLEAEKWFRMAAEQGYGPAQLSLGAMHGDGQGSRPDLVQAYMWFKLAISRFSPGENRNRAVENLDTIAAIMTPDQITEATRLAEEWQPKERDTAESKVEVKEEQQEKSMPAKAPTTGPQQGSAKTADTAQAGATISGFFVQLASVATMDLAREEGLRQQGAHPDILGDQPLAIQEADLGSQGQTFRIQVGPFQSVSVAERLCRRLKEKQQDCFVLRR